VAVVPAAGLVKLTAGGQEFESPIGTNGEFYFENVPAGAHRARVRFEGTACELTIEVPASADPVMQIGAHTCVVR
jgi:outer membrane usher protein FimD/PapC